VKDVGDVSIPRDEATPQVPDQPAVRDDMLASQHYHGVKGPRKKKEEDKTKVAIEDDVITMDGNAHKQTKKIDREKDLMGKDGSPKDNDIEKTLIDSDSSELSSNIDQERKRDGSESASGSFENINTHDKQHGGMTKKDNLGLEKNQPHDVSKEEEQHDIARKNGRKEKDKVKRNRNTPDEEDETEHWLGCVCDKWKNDKWKHGSKAGKSKGSKSKGSKSKGSKGKVYHNTCMKWTCGEDFA
jgi:hypothetical protein